MCSAGIAPTRLSRAVEAGGDGGESGTREDDRRAERDLDERELDGHHEIEVETGGGVDRDLEGLNGGATAEQQDDGKAGEGEEEDDCGEAGQGTADRGPIDIGEAGP